MVLDFFLVLAELALEFGQARSTAANTSLLRSLATKSCLCSAETMNSTSFISSLRSTVTSIIVKRREEVKQLFGLIPDKLLGGFGQMAVAGRDFDLHRLSSFGR